MASALFSIFDDIASLMDDIATMSKISAKQTAGVLGDDLAVNVNKATGFKPSRELPVLWAITKGSFVNKLILLPLAFLLSAFAEWLITPILMLGGIYLAYEGAHNTLEWLFHPKDKDKKATNKRNDSLSERKKICSAIMTDFILSIEIIIIALGTMSNQPLSVQIPVVTLISFAATIGVYSLVALIVRLDDMGAWLITHTQGVGIVASLGRVMLSSLPKIVKFLSIVGTLAMLIVAGGIFLHHISWLNELFIPFPSLLAEFLIGLLLGLAAVFILGLICKIC